MRLVRELPNPHCKITIFAWNNRYLIKLEKGTLEQTYKISETDVSGDDELVSMIDDQFINIALETFDAMGRSLHEAARRSGA